MLFKSDFLLYHFSRRVALRRVEGFTTRIFKIVKGQERVKSNLEGTSRKEYIVLHSRENDTSTPRIFHVFTHD